MLDPRFGLAQGFATYDAEIPRGDDIAGELEAERRGQVVADRAIKWLEGQAAAEPFFLWVHLYDPHAPYDPPPAWLERAHGQPYDGEVAYADAQLGRLVDALEGPRTRRPHDCRRGRRPRGEPWGPRGTDARPAGV